MDDFTQGTLIGVIIGLIIGIGLTTCLLTEDSIDNDLRISKDTGNDFCIQVTGSESAIAKDWWSYGQNDDRPIEKGGIVCETPSYDSTHNIVVKKNSE